MLITAQQLQDERKSGNWVVFDCRFSLADLHQGREAYLEAHIPDAWYLDLTHDLSGPVAAHGGRHPLPDIDLFAAKLSIAGVGPNTPVAVYDAGGGMAARAWWLLRYVGHDRVYVLDGGFAAWLAAGGETSREVPEPRPSTFEPHVRASGMIETREVEEIVRGEKHALLVDARAPQRFRGDVEPLDPVAGHIPGARNALWSDNLTPDGHWLPADALRERFAPLVGVAGHDSAVVMYCGSGVTACANLFAMHLAGYDNAKLYPGSWSDWCSYADHPVATGPDANDTESTSA